MFLFLNITSNLSFYLAAGKRSAQISRIKGRVEGTTSTFIIIFLGKGMDQHGWRVEYSYNAWNEFKLLEGGGFCLPCVFIASSSLKGEAQTYAQ